MFVHNIAMYIIIFWHYFRKLDTLQPGIQESTSVAFQNLMSFMVLNILVFYYEWRLALFLLLNFPLAMMITAVLQLVIIYVYVYVSLSHLSCYIRLECGSHGACLDCMLPGVQVTAGLGFFSVFKSFVWQWRLWLPVLTDLAFLAGP